MILNNVKSALTGTPVNLGIIEEHIAQISPEAIPGKSGQFQLTFENAVVFPGLINSHDHLDFNLFPPLGHKTYNNYTEWGSLLDEKSRNSDIFDWRRTWRISRSWKNKLLA